jgi:hypothetical protein
VVNMFDTGQASRSARSSCMLSFASFRFLPPAFKSFGAHRLLLLKCHSCLADTACRSCVV